MEKQVKAPTSHGGIVPHIAGGCAIAGGLLGAALGQSWQTALVGALVLPVFVGMLWTIGTLWSRGLDRGARSLEARHKAQQETKRLS